MTHLLNPTRLFATAALLLASTSPALAEDDTGLGEDTGLVDCDHDADGDGWCDDVDQCDGPGRIIDADHDGRCDDHWSDRCIGDDSAGNADSDALCDDIDPCFGASDDDRDGDGLCDESDDSDGDGIVDAHDPCAGHFPHDIDSDGDGICNPGVEGCIGACDDECPGRNYWPEIDPFASDRDGDGIPNTQDPDDDDDGICDGVDDCIGRGDDHDGDGICDNEDFCEGDDAFGDTDDDGICEDIDRCVGFDAFGDTDRDDVCDDLDVCIGDDATGDDDGDGICNDSDAHDGAFSRVLGHISESRGNSTVSAGFFADVFTRTDVDVDDLTNATVYGRVQAGVWARAYGRQMDFLDVYADGGISPGESPNFVLDVTILGVPLRQQQGSSLTLPLAGPERTASKSYGFGPIRVTARVTAAASLYVNLTGSMADDIVSFDVTPGVTVHAEASAGVSVACAGVHVTGSVNAIDLEVPVNLDFDLKAKKIMTETAMDIALLSGRLALEVDFCMFGSTDKTLLSFSPIARIQTPLIPDATIRF